MRSTSSQRPRRSRRRFRRKRKKKAAGVVAPDGSRRAKQPRSSSYRAFHTVFVPSSGNPQWQASAIDTRDRPPLGSCRRLWTFTKRVQDEETRDKPAFSTRRRDGSIGMPRGVRFADARRRRLYRGGRLRASMRLGSGGIVRNSIGGEPDHAGPLAGFLYAVGRALEGDEWWWAAAGDAALDAMHLASWRTRTRLFATAARCYARAETVTDVG